jgi:hypothetical protein
VLPLSLIATSNSANNLDISIKYKEERS